MISDAELAEIASRHDTALSQAMLRALGITYPQHKQAKPTKPHKPRKRKRDIYAGLEQCRKQRYGLRLL